MLWYFMENKINHERIRPIRQMLLEMAVGNFSYRIQRSTADDEVESLILLLNMVAEELKSSFSHLSYVNPHNSYSSYVQASFIVDSSWIVKKISTDVSVLLGYSPKMLYGAAFEIILSEESAVSFNSIKEKLSKNSSVRLKKNEQFKFQMVTNPESVPSGTDLYVKGSTQKVAK